MSGTEPIGSLDFTALMLATEACALGDCLLFDTSTGGWRVATSAHRTAANVGTQAIARSAYGGSEVGKAKYQTAGVVPQAVSKLPVLTPSSTRKLVRTSSTGTLERIDAYTAGDDVVGYATWDGRVSLHIGIPWSTIASIATDEGSYVLVTSTTPGDIDLGNAGGGAIVRTVQTQVSGEVAVTITGLTAPAAGRSGHVTVLNGNIDDADTTLKHDSGDVDENGILFDNLADYALTAPGRLELVYDHEHARWRPLTAVTAAPTGAAGGDLSGTYPNPTVAKVHGVSVPASPTAGQTIVATSPTVATWQTVAEVPVGSAADVVGLDGAGGLENLGPMATSDERNAVVITATPAASLASAGIGLVEASSAGVSVNLYGLVAPAAGKAKRVVLLNSSTGEPDDFVIKHNSSSASAAADRFALASGADLTIPSGRAYIAVYSQTLARWLIARGES